MPDEQKEVKWDRRRIIISNGWQTSGTERGHTHTRVLSCDTQPHCKSIREVNREDHYRRGKVSREGLISLFKCSLPARCSSVIAAGVLRVCEETGVSSANDLLFLSL